MAFFRPRWPMHGKLHGVGCVHPVDWLSKHGFVLVNGYLSTMALRLEGGGFFRRLRIVALVCLSGIFHVVARLPKH